ncbi:Cysteine-rich protein 2-binding protein [Araneus ventricosus]|uniref:Cysteine-rich protein 2-binding protein n=1 Tax=Araneus ventricosus TaxID=182803 RepID=A0A4Y2EJB2_ARAVE|nr:Cysteine-rich protein 2-binding protein [Araneus ventricosus]
MEVESPKSVLHCYCLTNELEHDMLTCASCKKNFHLSCLRSGRPSPLSGDIYFNFTCQDCCPNNTEIISRIKMHWSLVIMIALYNLQLQGGGKCGYYRWREHICRFIDKNWTIFFGEDRKKSATWHGTVAGALSNFSNRCFVSGMEVLGETGWWSLKSSKLPSIGELDSLALSNKAYRKRQNQSETESPVVEGSRKKNQNVVEAAVALKEKKASIACDIKPPKPKKKRTDSKTKSADMSTFPFKHKLKLVVSHPDVSSSSTYFPDENSKKGIPKIIIKKDKDCLPTYPTEDLSVWIKEPPMDLDLNIENVPSDIFDTSNSLDAPENINNLFDGVLSEMNYEKVNVKQEYESEDENSNSSKTVGTTKKLHHPDTSRKRKAVTKEESPVKEVVMPDPKFTLMSPYEEEQLLQKLENYPTAMKERPEIRRLYRKLKVRKLKRERKLPIFDIDVKMRSLRGMDPPDYVEHENLPKPIAAAPSLKTILDRFQSSQFSVCGKSQQHASFFCRLMGLEDEEQSSIVSPYTQRILKPFIFRDYKVKPLKMQLLEEILAYTNKNNPEWVPLKQSPIDYCYVRPQHIPGINALCHEFFWPGIDMSESLQYPDFSCVALYKKVIVGFAFMVPDVKYNEAYITFIFCHPEWRRCGIATFMLYHLVQTCMGKDVTLHVSASSSAVFLYQKFGFKVEEFIHDFYDKYLPPDSKECRHALFLRLSR